MTNKELQEQPEELAILIWEELIVEFPVYKAFPEPMAVAMIRLGVNNGIYFSAVSDYKELEKVKKQRNVAVEALKNSRNAIEEHNQIYDTSVSTARLLEEIDGTLFEALAEIEKLKGRENDQTYFVSDNLISNTTFFWVSKSFVSDSNVDS